MVDKLNQGERLPNGPRRPRTQLRNLKKHPQKKTSDVFWCCVLKCFGWFSSGFVVVLNGFILVFFFSQIVLDGLLGVSSGFGSVF